MNAASIVTVIIIAVLFLAAVAVIKKKKMLSSCSRNCSGCSLRDSSGNCSRGRHDDNAGR